MKKKLIFLLFIAFAQNTISQNFSIKGEFRPRAEYYSVDMKNPQYEPNFCVTQRSRISLWYDKPEKMLQTKFTLQDARVWGNTKQKPIGDNNSLSIFEAWCKCYFTQAVSLRLGRQQIVYDDKRIFGDSDFYQQGRSHDMALLQYNGVFSFDVGVAWNDNTQMLGLFKKKYDLANYKTIQFAHFNKKNNSLDFSILILNNGYEKVDTTKTPNSTCILYSQTSGTRIIFDLNEKWQIRTNFYYQSGKDHKERKLNAYNISGDIRFDLIPKKLNLAMIYDLFSGTSENAKPNVNNSFTLIYGNQLTTGGMAGYFLMPTPDGGNTYHNGYSRSMIQIIYNRGKISITEKMSIFHIQNNTYDANGRAMNKQLAKSSDLVISYKFNDEVSCRLISGMIWMTKTMQNILPTHNKFHQYITFDFTYKPIFFEKISEKK